MNTFTDKPIANTTATKMSRALTMGYNGSSAELNRARIAAENGDNMAMATLADMESRAMAHNPATHAQRLHDGIEGLQAAYARYARDAMAMARVEKSIKEGMDSALSLMAEYQSA